MTWKWGWLIGVSLLAGSTTWADEFEDDCLALDAVIVLEMAQRSTPEERREFDERLRRDPGDLQAHHWRVAQVALGHRKGNDGRASILALVEQCPASELLATERVAKVQSPVFARAWQRAVRKRPSAGAMANWMFYRARGKPMAFRARRHKGISKKKLEALDKARASLEEGFGGKDRDVRLLAGRAERLATKLLEDDLARQSSTTRAYPYTTVARTIAVEPDNALIVGLARASLAVGKERRAIQLAGHVLTTWNRRERNYYSHAGAAMGVLWRAAKKRGDRSLARALHSIPGAETSDDGSDDAEFWKEMYE